MLGLVIESPKLGYRHRMGFADLSSADAVEQAMAECDRLGEDAFLEQYRFGASRHVCLFANGRDYPAKAIVGVAHGFQFPDAGPITAGDFTSGDSTINKLRQLGFEARRTTAPIPPRLFVVRGGSNEEIVDYALDHDVVANGWSELGDLSILGEDGIDQEMDVAYGGEVEDGTLRSWKTALHVFLDIRRGDWVILPITSADKFAVGTVTGDYDYRPDNHELATSCYPVRWVDKEVSRDLLGDLRTRVDRQPAVHKIAVDDAARLVERMLKTREPIRLGGNRRLTEVLESALAAVAGRDLNAVKRAIDVDGPEGLDAVLDHRHPIGSGTGQATPADVPWIAVYPIGAEVASAKEGIYAVYLFAADGSAAYLSFMQGTENVAGGLPPLRKRVLDMRRAAGLAAAGDPVALASENARPKKYTAGSAYAIRYDRGNVPADETLFEDLRTVLGYVDTALEAGLKFDPMREPMHLLFKWKRDIEPKTIERHRDVAERRGHTWWGKFGSVSMGANKLSSLRSQLDDGVPTHAYLYGDKRLFRTRLVDITTDPDRVPDDEIPSYYSKQDCSLFACISDFEELEPAWAIENLVLTSDPDPAKTRGALSNQTTPLFVYEVFVAPEPIDGVTTELTFDWLQAGTLWTSDGLEELLEALEPDTGKGQVVLAGPPGTGKTWVAEHVARYLTEDQPLQRRLVQFHPSYGYEEFVEGIRPVAGEQGISFEPVKGTVLRLAEAMEGTDAVHVLIIDELNRANIPRVFGELLYLLEYREQEIDLQYSSSFQLPRNLRIIATMNTADRSIRSIDVALRRRFEIFECPADADLLQRFYDLPANSSTVPGLVSGFGKLNDDLTSRLDRHHTIGQSFFMASSYDRARLQRTWQRQILPLIEDYFFDQPDVVAEFTLDKYWSPPA